MTATWWADPDAGDIVPAGPGWYELGADIAGAVVGDAADVSVSLVPIAGEGDTPSAASIVLRGRFRPRRAAVLGVELTGPDCIMLAAALLAAAGVRPSSPAMRTLRRLGELDGARLADVLGQVQR